MSDTLEAEVKLTREDYIDECETLISNGRWYFEHDFVEIIWNSDMDCWIYLDFNTMKFDTADAGKQHWLLEKLSTETMTEEIKKFFEEEIDD